MRRSRYVGAIGVRDGAIYCRDCLLQFEVLYYHNSQISTADARKKGLRCIHCGELLTPMKIIKDENNNTTA